MKEKDTRIDVLQVKTDRVEDLDPWRSFSLGESHTLDLGFAGLSGFTIGYFLSLLLAVLEVEASWYIGLCLPCFGLWAIARFAKQPCLMLFAVLALIGILWGFF